MKKISILPLAGLSYSVFCQTTILITNQNNAKVSLGDDVPWMWNSKS